jgi:hypothetical protein
MKTIPKSLVWAGGLAAITLAWGANPAQAQAMSFGYAGPGVSVGVNTGGFGVGGPVYGGYPLVAPGPVVVSPVIVPRPMVVGGGFYRGGYRPYYRRW